MASHVTSGSENLRVACTDWVVISSLGLAIICCPPWIKIWNLAALVSGSAHPRPKRPLTWVGVATSDSQTHRARLPSGSGSNLLRLTASARNHTNPPILKLSASEHGRAFRFGLQEDCVSKRRH